MIRITALFLTVALALSGCKKPTPKVAQSNPAAPVEAGSTTAAPASGAAAPASAPDFAAPAATASKGPVKPAIDLNASVIAFCYHNIENGPGMKALTITVEQFEKEMQGIKDAGFSVIGMQDFIAWRRGEKSIPHKSCLITIDDGWVSGYNNAWPILKKFQYPFTMFVYVNYVGTGGKSLSWQQLEEMRDAGVDIESHTYSHANLKAPTNPRSLDAKNMALVKKDIATLGMDGWMRKEIIESKKKIEQQLGIKVNAIAYPFGIYNEKARELVKEAGYEAAFTVYGQRLSRSSPFDLLGRYAIEAAKPKIFADALAMIGGGGGTPDAAPSTVGQLAASSMVTQPLDNETITNPLPLIKANLATMGDLDADTLKVRLSGIGEIKPVMKDKLMTAQVTQKLPPGSYSVIVSAKSNGVPVETRWGFTVAPSAGSVLSGATPFPAAVTPEPKAAPAGKPKPKKK